MYGVIPVKIKEEHGIQGMSCSSNIIGEKLFESFTREICDFLKLMNHSQII